MKIRPRARNFAMAAVLAVSALACWSGGAFGQVLSELPKEYRGTWCWTSTDKDANENFYRRCRGEEGSLNIRAQKFTEGEPDSDIDCLPIHVIGTTHGDMIVQAVCRKSDGNRDLLDQRWKLLNGGRRLRVFGGPGVRLPDSMRGLDPRQ